MKRSFAEWQREVNSILIVECGLGIDDLPDCCYADWYQDGVSPKSAAKRAIRHAKDCF